MGNIGHFVCAADKFELLCWLLATGTEQAGLGIQTGHLWFLPEEFIRITDGLIQHILIMMH